jgi:hypothetical protein
MQYYGAFYRSALLPLLRRINAYLMRWLRKKDKRLAPKKKARACWERVTLSTAGCSPTGPGCPILGGQDDRSRVTGDCYARICGARREGSSGLPDLKRFSAVWGNRYVSGTTGILPVGKRLSICVRYTRISGSLAATSRDHVVCISEFL